MQKEEPVSVRRRLYSYRSARIGSVELRAQHAYLARPKVRWWLAAGGNGAQVRNLKVSEGTPLAAK